MEAGDFPGSPMVKTPALPLQEAWVQSLMGELRSCGPCSMAKKKNLLSSLEEATSYPKLHHKTETVFPTFRKNIKQIKRQHSTTTYFIFFCKPTVGVSLLFLEVGLKILHFD